MLIPTALRLLLCHVLLLPLLLSRSVILGFFLFLFLSLFLLLFLLLLLLLPSPCPSRPLESILPKKRMFCDVT